MGSGSNRSQTLSASQHVDLCSRPRRVGHRQGHLLRASCTNSATARRRRHSLRFAARPSSVATGTPRAFRTRTARPATAHTSKHALGDAGSGGRRGDGRRNDVCQNRAGRNRRVQNDDETGGILFIVRKPVILLTGQILSSVITRVGSVRPRACSCCSSSPCARARCALSTTIYPTFNDHRDATQQQNASLKPFSKRPHSARAVITDPPVACPHLCLAGNACPTGPGDHAALIRCV